MKRSRRPAARGGSGTGPATNARSRLGVGSIQRAARRGTILLALALTAHLLLRHARTLVAVPLPTGAFVTIESLSNGLHTVWVWRPSNAAQPTLAVGPPLLYPIKSRRRRPRLRPPNGYHKHHEQWT